MFEKKILYRLKEQYLVEVRAGLQSGKVGGEGKQTSGREARHWAHWIGGGQRLTGSSRRLRKTVSEPPGWWSRNTDSRKEVGESGWRRFVRPGTRSLAVVDDDHFWRTAAADAVVAGVTEFDDDGGLAAGLAGLLLSLTPLGPVT